MAIENLTTYTEVDSQGWLTVTASKADVAGATRKYDCYLYKDFGIDYFNGLDLDFEAYLNSVSDTSGSGNIAVANVVGDKTDFGTTDISACLIRYLQTPATYRFELSRGFGLGFVDTSIDMSADTLYYCTLSRVADSDTIQLKIYSDSARTNLLDTLEVSGYGTSTKWQYLYGFVNINQNSTLFSFTGYIQNINLNAGVPFVPKVIII